ncbi:MAG: TlpA family protein disulfide reductase [Planctomycetes bacterium]|nr:TlpA family protein disulfide reductase [Planctomycetota bacterium]
MRYLKICLLVLLAFGWIWGCDPNSGTAPPTTKPPGNDGPVTSQPDTPNDTMPNFTLSDLQGNQVSLSDFQGKTVLLVFWATWCPPCRKEVPLLKELHQKYQGKEFKIVAVNTDRNVNKVKKFARDNKINYLVLHDSQQIASNLYKIRFIPSNFVIDSNGKLYTFNEKFHDAETKITELMQ